ncbi:MAG TPA: phenylphosphate carboxylase subunit delta [Verrucomicrobiota bacterium]|nr:phenylphosphate carboxylase subunit delta [Verrucomicrobiales bacterium]HRI16306.1 phenylphosphate carboxylase subunit delta [Verrucomicrobiota bacterium]
MTIPEVLLPRLRAIRLFLCDVDGVLTDGGVFMGAGGVEMKRFDIRDGLGLRLLQQAGVKVGWVSARPSSATTERANDLKVDFLVQSPAPKIESIGTLLAQAGFGWDATAYMGDDVIDLAPLRRARFAAAPADAHPEARASAQYVCSVDGGRGAVREVVELILRGQERWEAVVAKFAA